MKQKLHAPLAVEKQVVILYALTHGFLDSIPVDSILDFEHELFEYLDTNHSDIFETNRKTKDLPEEEALNSAIQEYKDMFLATKGSNSSTEDKLKSIQNA